ncbi:zinc finger and SCAN domain-containing protein 21-like [Cheilinus undulatus]|uniref:zinc finger and SCAN domain-containing protein 21-like n=1 Tax=Cheilinus undulatus TaxID=241271 RepID=UPI001BD43C87|nr:zinc finger and SCAN domain-containing protein 21-like [Cheilinus undulatus]
MEVWKMSKFEGVIPEEEQQREDCPQCLVSKEEQQKRSHNLDKEDSGHPHIKEEQEELWSSQEGEQLQGLEEDDNTKFPFTAVIVKSEDDEETPQSSQLYERWGEQMETGADGEDCGGAEPARSSDPETHLQPETVVKTEDSSEAETEDSEDWRETREHQSDSNSLENINNEQQKTSPKSHSCSECGKTFKTKHNLNTHMRIHTGDKPFSCSVCSKSFNLKGNMTKHM